MWLGFHDDLADPISDDPVARLSTRIVATGTMGGQGTYDPIKIKDLVGGRAWEHPSLLKDIRQHEVNHVNQLNTNAVKSRTGTTVCQTAAAEITGRVAV